MSQKKIMILISGIILFILPGCTGDKEVYDRDKALTRVLKVQSLQNFNPGDPAIVPEIESIVDSMANARRDRCYFGAVNVLIDRLFADGRYAEADSLAIRMQMEASEGSDSLSMAMAKRVRAQILYKLSQPESALKELESAIPYLSMSPNNGPSFGTATSIYEWIHIIARDLKDTLNLINAGQKYAEIVANHHDLYASTDKSEHYPVTALSFKAENELMRKNLVKAEELLDSAVRLIRHDMPARAYEHFYFTRSKTRAKAGDFSGAIADIDILLTTHKCFPWFYLQDLLQKAAILDESGQHSLSSETYSLYVHYHDSISSHLTDSRLQDLTLLYRSELNREQHRRHTMRMIALSGTILLLLVLFGVTLSHAIKERKRNRLLVERLHEYDRASQSLFDKIHMSADKETEERTISRLDQYMLTEQPYTEPGLGRAELAGYLGITPDALAQLIRTEYDQSVHSYINSFRVEKARRILDNYPTETIAEIAAKLGFGTARTLQRAFKERFGMTPTQYREASSASRSIDNQ